MASTGRSGDPTQVGSAAETYRRIQDTAPQALKDLPDETRAFYQQVSSSIEAGVDPELATEAARKATYGMTEQDRKNVQAQTDKNYKKLPGALSDFVGDAYGKGVFTFAPDIPDQMQADYNQNYSTFMQYTAGDHEQATKLAWESTNNVWGETQTGGSKRMMKYSPEKMYYVEGAPKDWVSEQFDAEITAAGYDPSKAKITMDFETARSEQPKYPVMVQNEQGIYEPLLGEDNLPLVFQPSVAESPWYKEQLEEQEKTVQQARAKRTHKMAREEQNVRREVMFEMRKFWGDMPREERRDWLKTDEGNKALNKAVNNLITLDKLPNDPELILESMRIVFDEESGYNAFDS